MRLTKWKAYRNVTALLKGQLIMSSETFELVYDGPALADHQMDVRDLVPALQGLGNLIREANSNLNDDKATVRVLINSEHKKGCFSVSVDVLQEIWDQTRSLIASENVKSAKEILDWLQILGLGSGIGLFGYFKWKQGRKTSQVQTLNDTSQHGSVQVHVEGDNNTTIIVPRPVFELGNDPKISKAMKDMMQPLKREGISELTTKEDGKEKLRITKDDAQAIEETCQVISTEETILSQSTIQAHLRPYDAEFNENAKTWGFWYGDKHVNVDIASTEIAKEAVERRQVSMDDLYKVDLEITERRLPSGTIRVDHKVLKVHERLKGQSQPPLL